MVSMEKGLKNKKRCVRGVALRTLPALFAVIRVHFGPVSPSEQPCSAISLSRKMLVYPHQTSLLSLLLVLVSNHPMLHNLPQRRPCSLSKATPPHMGKRSSTCVCFVRVLACTPIALSVMTQMLASNLCNAKVVVSSAFELDT